VWAAVQERFQPHTRRLLFVQGQPTERLKDALEAACRALRLRHVFGMEGTQSYYVSIYLQFGFTRRGMVRLPFWLAGQGQSEAILSLLDPATGSPSFQNLWRALRDYRRKNIVEERLRRVIAESPWVLPDWADELVHHARQKLDLGTVDAAQAATDTGSIIPFLDQPRLVWDPPHEPHFVSRLVNLAALDLSAERYDVLVGTKPVGSLLRQPDETYDVPEHVVLPSTSAQHSASLLDESGQTLTTGELTLWEPLEDVTVYELPSGRRLDAWRDSLAPHKSYVLMTAADLKVRPTPSQWCLTRDGTRRFVSLPSGWSAELQVVLDGEVLWTPYIGPGRRAATPEPVWARSVRVYCGAEPTVKLGDRVEPVVAGLGENTVLTFVRLGTRALEFVQDGSSARVDGLEVTPDIVAPRLAFTLGLRHGAESARVERAPEVDIVGTARLGTAVAS
jgi:hypothetical protein